MEMTARWGQDFLLIDFEWVRYIHTLEINRVSMTVLGGNFIE